MTLLYQLSFGGRTRMDDNTIDVSKEVESLVKKAEQAEKSEDAMRFSQAACNAANAMACVRQTQEQFKETK
jgi:hypothetical protein